MPSASTTGSHLRIGARVEAYCRIDDETIRSRESVTEPDLVDVLDPTLLRQHRSSPSSILSRHCSLPLILTT
jgi:Pyruvate/2-oxoacid:ferredoxin oxidoreductase gamma subunit